MDIMSDNRNVMAYLDTITGNKTSSLVQNGAAWNDLGTRGFSSLITITDLAMTIDDSDNIYSAYQGATVGVVTVAKYNGTSWSEIGSPVAGVQLLKQI